MSVGWLTESWRPLAATEWTSGHYTSSSLHRVAVEAHAVDRAVPAGLDLGAFRAGGQAAVAR